MASPSAKVAVVSASSARCRHDLYAAGAIQRCTGIPAASIAVFLASGAIPGGGVSSPESIIPIPSFIK
ncbi:MAG: hypothetical protein DWI63_02420 [Chloroflexi bacterium]|nr:MAG: hypothetical protein DWI63_02420 [Chloroflexota bacterium]